METRQLLTMEIQTSIFALLANDFNDYCAIRVFEQIREYHFGPASPKISRSNGTVRLLRSDEGSALKESYNK